MATVHTIPANDLIEHEFTETCVCIPTGEHEDANDNADESWYYLHHSLDGREFTDEDSNWLNYIEVDGVFICPTLF